MAHGAWHRKLGLFFFLFPSPVIPILPHPSLPKEVEVDGNDSGGESDNVKSSLMDSMLSMLVSTTARRGYAAH